MIEIWKDVAGYENYYQVSNLGNIKSKDRLIEVDDYINHHATCRGFSYVMPGKIMKQRITQFGYKAVSLVNAEGKQKGFMVHRLVAEAFLPNPNNFPFINHKDENKQNNFVDNLEWCTAEYNINYGTYLERRSNTQRYTNKNMRSVIAVDANDNVLQFISIRDAARILNIYQSNIQYALKKGTKCGGFYWFLKEGGNNAA